MDSHAYLKGLGWRGEGHSLDHHDRGLKKPLLISQKVDVLGLGKKKHDVADQWWMRALDSSLKDIGTGRQTVLSTIKTHGAKQGGLYGFFVKGQILNGTLSGSEVSSPGLTSGAMSPVVVTSATVAESSVAHVLDSKPAMTLAGSSGHDLGMDKVEKKKKRKRDSNAASTLDGSTEHDLGMDKVEKKTKTKRESNRASGLDGSTEHDVGSEKVEKKRKRKRDSNVASTLDGSTEHGLGMDKVEKKRKRKRDSEEEIGANGKKRKDKEKRDSVEVILSEGAPSEGASLAANAAPKDRDMDIEVTDKMDRGNKNQDSVEVLPLKDASSPADAGPNESGSLLHVDAKVTASEKKKKKGNKKEKPKERKKDRLKRERKEAKDRRREKKKQAREEYLKRLRGADVTNEDMNENGEVIERRWQKRLKARVERLKSKASEEVNNEGIKENSKTPKAELGDAEVLRQVNDAVTAGDIENGNAVLGHAAVVPETAPDFIPLSEVTERQVVKSGKEARRAARVARLAKALEKKKKMALEKKKNKAGNVNTALEDAPLVTETAPDFIPLSEVPERQIVKSGKAARRAAKVAKALEKRRKIAENDPVKAAKLAERERRKAMQKAAYRNKKRVKREERRGKRPSLRKKGATV